MSTDGRIPVAAAKRVAKEYDLRQALLIGYDGDMVHVVTYGATPDDCAKAAQAQDFWTGRIREFSFEGRHWQPIETAPLDDTLFLAVRADGAMMIWKGSMLHMAGQPRTPEHLRFAATHWMPLPQPPVTTKDGGTQ